MTRSLWLFGLFAVLSMVLSLTPQAVAKSAKGKGGKTAKDWHGTIVDLRTDLVSVDIGENKPMRVNALFTPDTVITVQGKPGTWYDLAKGQFVIINIGGGKAIKIDVQG